jgi:hypothetical protein
MCRWVGMIDLRARTMHLRTRTMELRARIMHLRARMMHLRARTIDLRARTIDLRARMMHLRARMMHLRARTIDLTARTIDLTARTMELVGCVPPLSWHFSADCSARAERTALAGCRWRMSSPSQRNRASHLTTNLARQSAGAPIPAKLSPMPAVIWNAKPHLQPNKTSCRCYL